MTQQCNETETRKIIFTGRQKSQRNANFKKNNFMSHVKCPRGKKQVSSCPCLSPQCVLHCPALYWLPNLLVSQRDWDHSTQEVPVGSLLWRPDGDQGSAEALDYILHLWDGLSFSRKNSDVNRQIAIMGSSLVQRKMVK